MGTTQTLLDILSSYTATMETLQVQQSRDEMTALALKVRVELESRGMTLAQISAAVSGLQVFGWVDEDAGIRDGQTRCWAEIDRLEALGADTFAIQAELDALNVRAARSMGLIVGGV